MRKALNEVFIYVVYIVAIGLILSKWFYTGLTVLWGGIFLYYEIYKLDKFENPEDYEEKNNICK